jgi:hypothetical protein
MDSQFQIRRPRAQKIRSKPHFFDDGHGVDAAVARSPSPIKIRTHMRPASGAPKKSNARTISLTTASAFALLPLQVCYTFVISSRSTALFLLTFLIIIVEAAARRTAAARWDAGGKEMSWTEWDAR